jgi:hypothetical protein
MVVEVCHAFDGFDDLGEYDIPNIGSQEGRRLDSARTR